jgi:hypothetical protein
MENMWTLCGMGERGLRGGWGISLLYFIFIIPMYLFFLWIKCATNEGKVWESNVWVKTCYSIQLYVLDVKTKTIFDKNTRKYIQILYKFHFETMVFSIGIILSWIQILINFEIKVGNKYFWIWLVNMVFKNTFSLENLMKYICVKL